LGVLGCVDSLNSLFYDLFIRCLCIKSVFQGTIGIPQALTCGYALVFHFTLNLSNALQLVWC
jgi:hypothetical protein